MHKIETCYLKLYLDNNKSLACNLSFSLCFPPSHCQIMNLLNNQYLTFQLLNIRVAGRDSLLT